MQLLPGQEARACQLQCVFFLAHDCIFTLHRFKTVIGAMPQASVNILTAASREPFWT